MSYYLRVFGIDDTKISVEYLRNILREDSLAAEIEIVERAADVDWTILNVFNAAGDALAQIERNPVIKGELGQEELNEFREIVVGEKPANAAKWLVEYFDKVEVIYAFQLLNAAFRDDNFDIVSVLKTEIWNQTGGILQADDEGFSNEQGYHILWQFSDDVTGNWSCAVLDTSGQWTRFKMDLGDARQRKEFREGKVPKNAIPM